MRRKSPNRKKISLMIIQSNFKAAKKVRAVAKRDAHKYIKLFVVGLLMT